MGTWYCCTSDTQHGFTQLQLAHHGLLALPVFLSLWTACGCGCVAVLSLAYSPNYFTPPVYPVLDGLFPLQRLSGIDLAVGSGFFSVFELKLETAQHVPVNGAML